jgi:DNA-binding MarR family transcriptional regulator
MKTLGDTAVAALDAVDHSANGNAFRLDDFLPHELSVTAGRSSRLLAQRLEAAFGLSIAEWRVLAAVGRFDIITPSAVAEHTDMDKVKVSRATASLVAADLLEQGPAPHDGRARLLRLTRKGRLVHDGITPLARAMESQLATGLSEEEWRMLRRCLRRLQEHMRSLQAGPSAQAAQRRLQRGPYVMET